MVTPEDFRGALGALGLRRGALLTVHTSFRSFAGFTGGPERLIDIILETVGEEGLAAFPTFTGTDCDGPDKPPVLDVARTACAFWVGVVPELARRRPAAVRSLDPTHSLALLGAAATELAQEHLAVASPCGPGSPFVRLAERRGSILLIGVDYNRNTFVHALEELAAVPYHLHASATPCRVIDTAGRAHVVLRRLHQWDRPAVDFNRLRPAVQAAGGERELRCGAARLLLVSAQILHDVGLEILRRDPLFLLAAANTH
jgi:aminoglycoside 3-N-acetyltransferase